MRNLIICDKNKKLINAVNEFVKSYGFGVFDDVQVICGDVIKVHEKTPNSKIVTASNPQFLPDGGLDLVLSKKYDWSKAAEFYFSNDLFYVVSVNNDRKSSKEILLRSAVGILGYSTKFTPILTGIGTGVGGIAIDVFVEVLKAILSNLSSANLSSADLSSANLSYADLSSANLSYANLSSANLNSANLRSANLNSANLRSANLRSANLRSANLRSADLSYANLNSTNLSSADLSYADLSYANLRSANLNSANLRSANLRSANLRSANLSSANLSYADLSSADLSYAKGLQPKYQNALNLLKFQKGKLIAYKYVKDDFSSPVNGNLIYKVGKTITLKLSECSKDDTISCDRGINVADLAWCVREGNNGNFVEVEFDVKDIVSIPYNTDGKFRIRKCKVLRSFNLKEALKMLDEKSNLREGEKNEI